MPKGIEWRAVHVGCPCCISGSHDGSRLLCLWLPPLVHLHHQQMAGTGSGGAGGIQAGQVGSVGGHEAVHKGGHLGATEDGGQWVEWLGCDSVGCGGCVWEGVGLWLGLAGGAQLTAQGQTPLVEPGTAR